MNPIGLLPKILWRQGQYIILGDFNLHHPLWQSDREADDGALGLLEIMTRGNAELITLRDLVTRKIRPQDTYRTTINLAFMIDNLVRRVTTCNIDKLIHHGLNHLLVGIKLQVIRPPRKQGERRKN